MELLTSAGNAMNRFKLPLEKGTWSLTMETLNKYSAFRNVGNFYLLAKHRKISYKNGILLIGAAIPNDEEVKISVEVKSDHLLIGCSADTNESYLSRYAYYALVDMMSLSYEYDFERFYWPGFFNVQTGKSEYLNIINDRSGMDVSLKPRYFPFYKPGQRLVYPLETEVKTSLPPIEPSAPEQFINDDRGIGYCLADTYFYSLHSNHWPFLVPYACLFGGKGKAVRSFIHFIDSEADLSVLDAQAIPADLNEICFQMRLLAPIVHMPYSNPEADNQKIRCMNLKNRNRLFLLWQKALPIILSQQFTHHLYTYGMKNVIGKPIKKYMKPCIFSPEVPRLCFSWRDKGDYFELKLLFKVKKKTLIPFEYNTACFITSSDDPMQFYLLSSLQDVEVFFLFVKYRRCMSVLKCHYEGCFKEFKEQLERVYEFV